MLKFAVRRLLLLVPILLGLSILVFLFVRALPGGPETALLGERSTPEKAAEVRAAYGLDRPVPEQYFAYMGKVVKGDFGTSIMTQRPVSEEIRRKFPATIELALSAMMFAVVIGLPLGFVAGRRPQSWVDNASTVGSLLGIAIPVFALGFLLKYVFAVKLGVLPSQGRQDVTLTTEHPTGFFVLDGLLTKIKPSPTTANFLKVLLQNGRLTDLTAINDRFAAVLDERSGLVAAEITSARELPTGEKAEFETSLAALTGKTVNVNYAVDPNIIGGVVTRIGSTVYDGSVKTKLENLKEQLVNG